MTNRTKKIRKLQALITAAALAGSCAFIQTDALIPIIGDSEIISEVSDTSAAGDTESYTPAPNQDIPSQDSNTPPAYEAPAYEAPVYEAPTYEAPVYETPIYETPVYDYPVHEPAIENGSAGSSTPAPSGGTQGSSVPKVSVTKKGVKPEDIPPEAKVIDAPYINQRASYPNGCEAVSAVMLLQYLGVDISAKEFINNYLDMGRSPYVSGQEWYACDPHEQYPGNPANSSGWGCYPEVIKKAIDSLAPEGLEAFTLKDVPLSTLCSEFIDNDIPVLFWGTIDMRKPTTYVSWNIIDTDRTHTWISPFHCLLLVGYDDEGYYFNDPWQDKLMHYDKDEVELAYSGIGREALAVLGNEAPASVSGD